MSGRLSALTTRGRAFVAAGIACTACAFLIGQKDLLRVAILLTALPLVTLLVVAGTRYRLSAQRTITPARVPAGQPANVGLRIENVGRLPTGLLLMEDRVPYALGARPRFVLDRISAKWTCDLAYPVRSDLRGRFAIGPATLRVTDPFGLVELTRSFRAADTMLVTPRVHPLPSARLDGSGFPSGDGRTQPIPSDGQEDITVREYRQGDDLRRVHWRSSARRGELMVRREEPPRQSRATVFLDTRRTAHRGQGPGASFEWAVSAAGSVAIHLLQRGYVVTLVTDTGATVGTGIGRVQGRGGVTGTGQSDAEGVLLDSLAVVELSERDTPGAGDSGTSTDSLTAALSPAPTPGVDPGGLLFAIVGFGDPAEIPVLEGLRQQAHGRYLIGLDPAAPGYEAWRYVVAQQGEPVAAVWSRLVSSGVPIDNEVVAR